ncbi:hypothetical protein D3C73_1295290 [compost metagenome]
MWEDEVAMSVADYVPHQDVTRLSVWEVRDFAFNPKRNSRVRRKVIKREMVRATYGKVPIGFWESVVAHGTQIEHGYFVADVEGQIRLYCSRLQSKATFLSRIVDHISRV